MFKVAVAITLACMLVSPVYAGGAVGKATEITQIANNIELGAILSENVEMLATDIEQLAVQGNQLTTQINQYTTMIQNLRSLPSQVFNKMLGGLPAEGQALLKLGRASWDLYGAANRASDVLRTAEYSMQTLSISPQQYFGYMVSAARAGDEYWREAVKRDTSALQEYQKRIEEWQQASASAGSVAGNLEGHQATAAMVAKAGAEITRLNAQISQANADANSVRAANAAGNVRSTEALQALEAAKRRAQQDDQKWRLK